MVVSVEVPCRCVRGSFLGGLGGWVVGVVLFGFTAFLGRRFCVFCSPVKRAFHADCDLFLVFAGRRAGLFFCGAGVTLSW